MTRRYGAVRARTSGVSPHQGRNAIAEQRRSRENRRGDQAEQDAVEEPAVTLIQAAGAERVGHQCVESEQQAHSEDGQREEEDVADADGADGRRPERAHDDGVHDAHADPADLGKDNGARQGEHGLEFVAKPHRTAL